MGSRPIFRPIYTHVPKAAPPEGAVGGEKLRQALEKNPPRRILLVARDQIGDVVNTTGAVQSLQQHFPSAEFTLELGERALGVFHNWPHELRLWRRKRHRGLGGKVRFIWDTHFGWFDLGVILDDSNEKVRLLNIAGVKLIAGIRSTKLHQHYDASVPHPENAHDLLDPLRALLELFGAQPDVRPRLYPSMEDREVAADWHERLGQPWVGIHIGATDPKKEWPAERFAELGSRLKARDIPCFLLAGPEALPVVRDLAAKWQLPLLQETLTLTALASLLGRLKAVVTADTGPAHIAAAADTTAVVLYGSTSPVRHHPWGARHVLLHNGFPCDLYAGRCVAEESVGVCDHRCMDSISVDEVFAAVRQVVG